MKHRNKSQSSSGNFDNYCQLLHHLNSSSISTSSSSTSAHHRRKIPRAGEVASGVCSFSSARLVHHLAHVMLTFLLLSLFNFFDTSFTSVFADDFETTNPTIDLFDSSETSTVANFRSFESLSSSSPSPWIIESPFNSSSPKISISSSLLSDMHVYNATSYKELELLSEPTQRFMSWLYGLTAAAALFGNIIAVLVLFKGKRMSKGTLRFFLINLALSDINVAAFSIPFTYDDFMKGRWEFWLFFCPVVQCMQITSVFVSVYTLAAIGVDRYVAIIYPLRSTGFSRPFIYLSLPAIWVGGFTMGLVQYTKTDAVAFGIAGEPGVVYYDCKELWTPEELQSFTLAIFIITYGLPMAVIAFTYFSIGLRMFNRAAPGNADAGRDRLQAQSNNKTLKMLIATVIVFACCWTPMQTLNMFIYYARDYMNSIYESETSRSIYVFLTFGSHWLSTANSFLNPIVYSGLSENFRHDLKFLTRQLLYKLPCCRPLLGPESLGNATGRSGRYGGASTIVGGNRGGGGHSTTNGRPGDRTMSTRMSSFYPSSGSNSGSLRNGNGSSPRGGGGGMAAKIVTSGENGTVAGAAGTDEGSSSCSSGSSRRQSATVMYHKSGGNGNSAAVQCYQLPSPAAFEQCNSKGKNTSNSNGDCRSNHHFVHQQQPLTAPGSGTEADDPLLVVHSHHGGQSVVMLLVREEESEAELTNCKNSATTEESDSDSSNGGDITKIARVVKVEVTESSAHHQSQYPSSISISGCSRALVENSGATAAAAAADSVLEESKLSSTTTTRPLSVSSNSPDSSSNSSFSEYSGVVGAASGPLAPLPPPQTTAAELQTMITNSGGGSFQTADRRQMGPTSAAAAASSTVDIHISISV